ncbi:hypothetical protein CGZ98_12125 [Enemella evansiae]|uniref:RBBP9/YdeN family alpha/beta hydrolase n=1 Tax=Enemella evansiae TaxID=2016499 RepID=UPI000B96C150|nr:alpha/beta hydrolase [Enemella evansiae]OYO09869.1 hypothetical protein CGZ98_12125 [Enemella evansiae]
MTTILVPGLRGPAPDHWQEHLARETGAVHLRTDRGPLELTARVTDLEEAVSGAASSAEPIVLVAHSAGVLTALHWAAGGGSTGRIAAALLITPPTLSAELPGHYPRLAELAGRGWLPLPRSPLPFPTSVGVSDDDALGPASEVLDLAAGWGAEVLRLGAVGHANPASGYGRWPQLAARVEAVSRRGSAGAAPSATSW